MTGCILPVRRAIGHAGRAHRVEGRPAILPPLFELSSGPASAASRGRSGNADHSDPSHELPWLG